MVRRTAVAITAVVSALALGGGAVQAPAASSGSETLVLNGIHPQGKPFHEGTFTATGVVCTAGTFQGTAYSPSRNGTGFRTFTCDDGSGTFDAVATGVDGEHASGTTGGWRVVRGTGAYVHVRGLGTWSNVSTGLDPPTFVSTWRGELEEDDVAPTLRIIGAAARRSRGSSVVVSFRLSARDAVAGDRVIYSVTVSAGTKQLARRAGSGGSATLALHVTPPRTTRVLAVHASATDRVGNTRTRSAIVALPR
jgi:hypothetical protein